jgi:hypothetical protein
MNGLLMKASSSSSRAPFVSAGCLLAGVFVAIGFGAGACGGPAQPAASPSETPAQSATSSPAADSGATAPAEIDAGAAPSGSASAPEAAPAPPSPLATVLMTDASEVQKMFDAASSAPLVTLKSDGVAGKDAIAAGLRAAAKNVAPGMLPDGPLGTGKLKEKGQLQMSVTLLPGKCYALLGFAPKAKDLDLYVLTPPGILAGQDTTDDNKPVVGKAPDAMCPAATRAVTYTVDIFADKGGGDVGVQLYSKDK